MCIFLCWGVCLHLLPVFSELFVFPLLSVRNCLYIFDNSFISVVPNELGTRNQFYGRQFSMDCRGLAGGWGGGGGCVYVVLRWFEGICIYYCTLFLLLLLNQAPYINHQWFDPRGLGTPVLSDRCLQRFSSSLWLMFSTFIDSVLHKYKGLRIWWSPAYLRSISAKDLYLHFLQSFIILT